MKEIISHLKEFDRVRNWNQYEHFTTNEEKIDYLMKACVGMLGEFGEFANELKKSRRDGTFNEEHLKEEITDTFIFLLKIAAALDMDLKEEFFKKMEINEKRFEKFKVEHQNAE